MNSGDILNYSNTTLVKVKFGECQSIIEQVRIQIQHLLKLNAKTGLFEGTFM